MLERSRKADASFATVEQTAPDAVSACPGWTTHEIAAHVTGIAVEVVRHLDPTCTPYTAGTSPVMTTPA